MNIRFDVLVTIVLALVAWMSAPSSVLANQIVKGAEMMETPPDPDKAVSSEYRMLMARGTVEAYELFIARHPDHPLAEDARKKLKELTGK